MPTKTASAKKEASAEKQDEPGLTCGGCGFPMATDQRYCLNCGVRRDGGRIDYASYLAAGKSAAVQGPGTAGGADRGPSAHPPRREASPLLAVGGIGLLGLMLLVGVLIGRGGDQPTPEPAVVQVGQGAEGTSAAAAPATPAAGAAAAAKAKKKSAPAGEVTQASSADLEALDSATGEEFQEASEKLPDTVATPGEPPPTDNAKPGGGSKGVVID